MIREGIDRLDAILMTHPHADHISGMDDLRNFTYDEPVTVYGNGETLEGIRERFGYFFRKTQRGGGKPKVKLCQVSTPFKAGGLSWIPLPVLHGQLPVLGYRTGRFAYVTDASHIPAGTEGMLAGLDVLVLGALRYRPHETHMNIEQAVSFAERIKPERTWLTHFCHDIEHAKLARELPAGIFPAYDGLKITLKD
jgi:phosphoribosyl 1,2-cyclic phosphate phosphodiesterase